MMVPSDVKVDDRAKPVLVLVGIWLLACAFMLWLNMTAISHRSFPDPDDVMRLLEVRDWLAGQSWFDVSQYRLNGPAGVPMHWSRLVDLPIAGVIIMVRPLAGSYAAETAALILVPLFTLGIAIFLVYQIAIRLMTTKAALVAAAATPLSLGAMKQMRPLRIDHHGWQIVLALAAVIACLDSRPRRAGFIAGAAMALWLNISIEGLPFVAAIGALFAFDWLQNGGRPTRLATFLGSLALSSILLFGLTHAPSTWFSQPHDVVTIAHLAGFATAWICCLIEGKIAKDNNQSRLVALTGLGAASLIIMFAVDPHLLSGPFSGLDPLVRELWYDKVDEGLPMWRVDLGEALIGIAQPIVGMIGAAVATRRASTEIRGRWATYLYLLGVCTLASLFVLRTATTASVIAMPGTAFLCRLAFRRARALGLIPLRVVATSGAVFVMAPAYALPASFTTLDEKVQGAVNAGAKCTSSAAMSELARLPVGEVAAPLDITPAILLNTRDRAIASGHHRNIAGMRDVISLFIGPPDLGKTIIARRHVDYVVMCSGAPETLRYAHRGPGGLAAALSSGRTPNWLEPVQTQSPLHVWRVRKAPLVRA